MITTHLQSGRQEVETIDRSSSQPSMNVSWDISHGQKEMFNRTVDVYAVNMYMKLSGKLKEGSYYQSFVTFPSLTQDEQYETFTCTKQYKKGRGYLDEVVKTFNGNNSFEYKSGEKGEWDEINSDDEVSDAEEWEFAGWKNKFDIDVNIPEHEIEDDEWGCRATRIFFAYGNLLPTIDAYYPD